MGKRLIEAPVTTKNARASLAPGVHWRAIDPDVHLGYRKSKRGGNWIVRWRHGSGYKQAPLGTADDIFEGDGVYVMSFAQATAAARAYVSNARAEAKALSEGPAPTVRSAVEAYISSFEARQMKTRGAVTGEVRSRFSFHILADEKIIDMPLLKLQSSDIIAWKKRIRAKAIAETTVRRIASDLRAALNAARVQNRTLLPVGFAEMVKDGFAIGIDDPTADSERPNIILDDDEVRLIVRTAAIIDEEQGWDGDLYHLVVGMATTGGRFSQLARIPVADLQGFLKRLVVPSSKKGRGKNNRPPAAVPMLDDELAILKRAVAGRSGKEPLFMTWGYKRGEGIKWVKEKRRPWQTREISKPFRAIVARAGFSPEVTAYALRHSSIARNLRAGLHPRHVAALHDTSIQMIERYYSKFIVDAFDALAAAARVPLVSSTPA
jgi:integrase